jgi:hypothetical protein
MSARMAVALGLLCLLAGMLQGSADYPAKPVRIMQIQSVVFFSEVSPSI